MAILRPKILVVDDEPDLEHLVRQRMRREIRSGHVQLYVCPKRR